MAGVPIPPAAAARILAATALVLTLAGCGATAPDLFDLRRTGSIPGARLRLVVSDAGTARCNGDAAKQLPPELLLEARELERLVGDDAQDRRRFRPGPGSVLSYRARTGRGAVSWSDTSRPLPRPYLRLAFLTRRIAKGVCGLPR